MKETVFDVLIYLFENFLDTDSEEADPDAMRNELLEAGFSDVEIDKAFDWLGALADQPPMEEYPAHHVHSIRIFSAEEQERLDLECQGFLISLENSGILDKISRELVVDRFMALESEEPNLDQLKWVVLMVLFNQPGSEAAYAWMEDLVYENEPASLH